MRWPWHKRTEIPNATPNSYQRWIEAGRPPFDWFMRLSELEQDALANIGADYVDDVSNSRALALLTQFGEAVKPKTPADPEVPDDGALIRQVAEAFGSGARGDNGSDDMNLAQALHNREQGRQDQADADAEAAPQTLMGKAREPS